MERSIFAKALKRLFDDTGFAREVWARILQVPESSISEWVDDKSIPRSDLLRMTLDILRNSAGVSPEVLTEFDGITRKPATKVSSLAEYIGSTVGEYMDEKFTDIGRRLRDLSPSQQIRMLRDGCVGPFPT